MTDSEKQKLNAETVNATVTQMLGAKDLQIAQLTGVVKVLQAEIEALKKPWPSQAEMEVTQFPGTSAAK